MANFFDSLLGLESDPESRDYRLSREITSPDELEAYRAGASATGIPGLDYARSVLRGIGKEISEPSMGPLGERYGQTMRDYAARQEAAQRLRERFPGAFRAGRLGTVGNLPGAEAVFLAQPGIAGAAGAAGRSGARTAAREAYETARPRALPAPSILEGEFSEVPQVESLGYHPTPAPTPRTPIAPSQSQRPMNRFAANQGYMTTGIPGNDLYLSSLMRGNARGASREFPIKPTAGIHDEAYPVIGDQRKPFNPEYSPNKFDQNAFDAWRLGRRNKSSGKTPFDSAERFGGFDTDLQLFRPSHAARIAREEYETQRPGEMTTFRPNMPRSTMIEGEFSEAPSGGGGMPPRIPGSGYGIGSSGGPSIFDSRIPMFAKQGLGMGAGAAAYLAGQSAYDRAKEILNRQPVVSEDAGRKVQLPPIDVGMARRGAAETPLPPSRPHFEARPVKAKRATTSHPAEDNRRYWGDWRDVEPYASDPIGNFIDELRGETKSARHPGTINYASGGEVRQHYGDGGFSLGDIGDAISGGLSNLTSGKSPVTGKPFHMGPISQGLLTAGMGMMSSPSHSLARAIGEGGIAGIKAYDVARQRENALTEAERERLANLKFEEDLQRGPRTSEEAAKTPAPPMPVPQLRRGGVAQRQGYAMGGGESGGFGPFDELGDTLSSGLEAIGETIGSVIAPSAEAAEAGPRVSRGPGPISQGLLTAGLGMMASPSHSAARAIGEGGLRGIQAYQTAAERRDRENREATERAANDVFSQTLTKTPEAAPSPVPEPVVATDREEAPAVKVPEPVVATDREETVTSPVKKESTPKVAGDPVADSMRRIEWLNSHVPQNATQERILNRMINEEKFKIQMAQKQSGSQGVIGILSQDEFGRPRRGWISGPNAGKYIDETVPGSPKPVGKNVHGDDFLTSLSPDMASTVQAIAEGRTKLPSGPRAAQLRSAVYQYDPNYRESRFDVTQSLAKPSGYNFGATIGSGNMAIKHLGEISDAVEDLKKAEWAGGKFRPLNWLQQNVKANMPGGFPEVERFKTAADRFSEEATKFYRGSGGNQADIQRAIERMNSARSPQELHDILEEETRLFSGKVKGLGAIYNQSFSSPYVDMPEFKPLEDTSNDIIDVIKKRASKPYSHTVHDISERKSETKNAGPQPTATGTYNGVHVTRYSDGSIRNTETGEVLKGPSAGE